MRVFLQLYYVYTSIIIVFYAEHFLKMVIKDHILVCSHNKTTTDHAIKHIKNINGPRKGCLTTQDIFPDHSFLNWQTPFGSNRVPADLMNDNVGQMYKNFEANSVSSPTRYLVCMASFNYTKHLKRGIPNCS